MRFSNVLVTGGAGFVGSQLIRRLEPISDHIWVIDNLSAGTREAVADSAKITFYPESVTNEQVLQEVLPQTEWIFHLACRSLTLSVGNMHDDFATNLYGGFLLLDKTNTICPRLKKFVYTSTASIYGNAPVRPTPEHWFQTTTPYSASKFAVEHYCQVFYHMFGLPVTIVRLSNVFGPGQLSSNPYCGVVSKFFEAVKTDTPFTIYGDGEQTRDFTYVEDAVEAILIAAAHPDSSGKRYNIGTGKETSINRLAQLIAKVAGRPGHPLVHQPQRVIDNVVRRSVDIAAIGRDLRWQPRYSLQEGLEKTYQWVLNRHRV